MTDLLREKIKAEASRLGFSFTGFSKPTQTPHFLKYESWLFNTRPDELDYLGKKYVVESRKNPTTLLNDAKTVITLGCAYQKTQVLNDFDNHDSEKYGMIAAYACLPDYHFWLKSRVKALITYIERIYDSDVKSKFFVDSGPVMEKDFAYLSGLGWIGKNSLFISPVFGSYCLLGCLFINIELQPDQLSEIDLCGDCEMCINACPTGAINQGRTINANKCIAFLTTNYKGIISPEQCRMVGNNIFGCDICQNVCPINNRQLTTDNLQKMGLKPIIQNKIHLASELNIRKEIYSAKYSNTPLSKFPFELFIRNLIIALGNSGKYEFIESLNELIRIHPTPIVRATASWALTSLAH
jgi:epoxyqueuosine reductase